MDRRVLDGTQRVLEGRGIHSDHWRPALPGGRAGRESRPRDNQAETGYESRRRHIYADFIVR